VGLLVALTGVLVASGWWVIAMELLPASARPFVGGSTNNSALDLILGYDGLGRIFGGSGAGPGGGGGAGGGFSGTPGLLRLFNPELGGQIAWFLPLGALGLAVGLWARRHAPRTDLRRAAYLMWGSWLAVHAVVFSFMSGIIHSYYAVAMAPAIGALVGGGVVELWAMRARSPRLPWAGLVLAGGLLSTAGVAFLLLGRTPDFAPGLAIAVAGLTLAVAVVFALPSGLVQRKVQLAAVAVAVAVLLAGPAAYAFDTMTTAYAGGDPAAGPQVGSNGRGGFASGPGGGFGQAPNGAAGGQAIGAGGPADEAASSALTDYLVDNRGTATWIVAVTSANQAGSIELATGLPVMAMGGFSGSDPAPTLDQLKALVASGELRFVIVGARGGGGPGGGSSTISQVDAWVQANGTVVSGVSSNLYDLSGAVSTDA
jgi:4-amino-4-deoxy-L-arabinose transferase-like glycosyltransferase